MKTSLYYLLPILLILFGCSTDYHLTEETTATYHRYYRNNHLDAFWVYHVHNTPYSETPTIIYGSWIDGQACYIKYNAVDPTVYKVIRSKPIFYTDEHTTVTKAKVLKVSDKKVRFTYHVNKKGYSSFQLTDKKIMEIKKGDSIQIEYWDKDPKRSIILLKNPTYEVHVKRHL